MGRKKIERAKPLGRLPGKCAHCGVQIDYIGARQEEDDYHVECFDEVFPGVRARQQEISLLPWWERFQIQGQRERSR